MRVVGMGLILSGFSLDVARGWLARTIPDPWQQHCVSSAWNLLQFRCGAHWWH
jgi:hypothetical protein